MVFGSHLHSALLLDRPECHESVTNLDFQFIAQPVPTKLSSQENFLLAYKASKYEIVHLEGDKYDIHICTIAFGG